MSTKGVKRITARSRSPQDYAQAWRKFLKDLLIAKIRTKKQREDLAKKMDVSVHYINSMLYRQEGGIDAWSSALSIAYELKLGDIPEFLETVKSMFGKQGSPCKSDQVWRELDEIVNENEKFYWISLLHALIVADK